MNKPYGALLAMIAVVLISQYGSISAQDRVLPIHGEVLHRKTLALPAHDIDTIALSPDGRWLWYRESSRQTLGDYNYKSFRRRCWVVNVLDGSKRELEGTPADLLNRTLNPRGPSEFRTQRNLPPPEWTNDSRKLGYVEPAAPASADQKRVPSLYVWDFAKPGVPQKLDLSGAMSAFGPGFEIADWAWSSPSGEEILLVIGPVLEPENRPPAMKKNFTFQATRDRQWVEDILRERASRSAKQPPAHFVRFNLQTGAVEIESPRPLHDVVLHPSRKEQTVLVTMWDRRPKLPLSPDPKQEAKQLRWISAGYAEGRPYVIGDGSVYELDVAKGSWRALSSGRREPPLQVISMRASEDALMIEGDNSVAYGRIARGWATIKRISESGKLITLVRDVSTQARVFPTTKPNTVYYHETGRMNQESGLFEVDISTGDAKRVDTMGLSVSEFDTSADSSVMVAVLESVKQPPALFVRTAAKPSWRPLTADRVEPDPLLAAGIARREFITWRSADDTLDLDGILNLPLNFDPKKRYPLIISLRGGNAGSSSDARNEYDLKSLHNSSIWVNIAAEQGYIVLQAAHRASNKMTAEHRRRVKRNLHDVSRYDLAGAINHLARIGMIDPTRVGIIGHSAGGTDVGDALANTNLFKAGVVNDGFIFFQVLLQAGLAFMDSQYALSGDRNSNLAPEIQNEAFLDVFGFDPIERPWSDPYKIKVPLLTRFAANGMDVTQGWRALDAQQGTFKSQAAAQWRASLANNVPTEIIIDAGGHGPTGESLNDLEWTNRVIQWFDYFICHKGENPIPAMRSPFDYSKYEKGLKNPMHP